MTTTASSKSIYVALFFGVAAIVAGLDLWSKDTVFEFLKVVEAGNPPRVVSQERYEVIADFFELEANYNRGAFAGMFGGHTGMLALLSAVAVVIIFTMFIVFWRKPEGPGFLFTLALSFLWGGTIGNLYDRYYLGAVRDWIKWFFVTGEGATRTEHVWPNFNVADSGICVGVSLLIILEVRRAIQEKRAGKATVKA
jgi:signal peptidase II